MSLTDEAPVQALSGTWRAFNEGLDHMQIEAFTGKQFSWHQGKGTPSVPGTTATSRKVTPAVAELLTSMEVLEERPHSAASYMP
jgi:hypothetical protein